MKNLLFASMIMFASASQAQQAFACPQNQQPAMCVEQKPIKVCQIEESSYRCMGAGCPVYKDIRLTVYASDGKTIFSDYVVRKIEEDNVYQIMSSGVCN